MADNTVYIELAAKVDKIEAALSGVEKKIDGASSKAEGAFSKLGKSLAILGGGYLSFDALTGFLRTSAQAAIESAKAEAKVAQAIKTTGGAAGFTTEELKKMSAELMTLTGIDDDQIMNDVTAQLLTFTNIAGQSFNRAQKAAMDLSAVIGNDLKSQTMQLGKALEDPIAGVGALSRVGVTFTDVQKDMIKNYIAHNDLVSAQNIILTEIETKYGGQAEAANLASGGIMGLTAAFGDLTETVGGFVMDLANPVIYALTKMITPEETLADVINEATNSATNQIAQFDLLVNRYSQLAKNIHRTDVENKIYQETIQALQKNYPNYLNNIDLEKGSFEEVKTALDNARASLEKYLEAQVLTSIANKHMKELVETTEALMNAKKALLDSKVPDIINEDGTINEKALNDIVKQDQQMLNHNQNLQNGVNTILTNTVKNLEDKTKKLQELVLGLQTQAQNITKGILPPITPSNQNSANGNGKAKVNSDFSNLRADGLISPKNSDGTDFTYKDPGETPEIFVAWEEKWPQMAQVTTDAIQTIDSVWANSIHTWLSEGISFGSAMENLWKNMADQILTQIIRIATQWALLQAATAIFGGATGGFGGFLISALGGGAHYGGEFAGGANGKPIKLSRGGNYLVPEGFNNDSFGPFFFESGERINVTSSQNMRSERFENSKTNALLQQLITYSRATAMNQSSGEIFIKGLLEGDLEGQNIKLAVKQFDKINKNFN